MAGDADRQGRTDAHPIDGMARLSPRQLQALKSQGLTVIKSFVAGDALDGGEVSPHLALDAEADALGDVLQCPHGSLGKDLWSEPRAWRRGGAAEALLERGQQRTADGSAGGEEKP